MKYLVVLLLLACSSRPKYKAGQCFFLVDSHQHARIVYQVTDFDEYWQDYYACRVDGIGCDTFNEDEIQEIVSCPMVRY